MATPVETPQPQAPSVATGGAPAGAPAPEPQQPTGGAPVTTETPSVTSSGGQIAPDGTMTSGRGSSPDPAPEQTSPDPAATPSPQGPESPATDARPEISELPQWAQDLIRETRDEVAKTRVNAKQAAADEARKQMAQDIAKALGIVTDETPAEEQLDPDQLRDLLAGERTTARQARVELAVFKAAQAPDATFNAQALLDSRAFLDSIRDVDPTDSEAINQKIAEAVGANPWLAVIPQPTDSQPTQQGQPQAAAPAVAPPAAPAAPPTGGQFAGGPGAQPQDLTTMSIDDFRRLRQNRNSS